MSRPAAFSVVHMTDAKIFIEDLCLPLCLSVTNDAENVVEQVSKAAPGRRIIYKDSEGNWDELLHDNGFFTGFFARYTEELP